MKKLINVICIKWGNAYDANYVNTLHYTHPILQKKDTEKILQELERFYVSLKLNKA